MAKTAENVKIKIVKTAMANLNRDDADKIEDAAWAEIISIRNAGKPIAAEWVAAIKFGIDSGVLSAEYKFVETDDRDLARILWTEFADEIGVVDVKEEWKRELVDTPRAVRPDALQWHDKRLRRANFPIRVSRFQSGEIFGGQIEWGDVQRDVDLEWRDTTPQGVLTDIGDCYSGWDDLRKIYLGTSDSFENNDIVARIAL